MVEIVWQDPPARSGGSGKNYSPVIDELMANPGRWALVIKDWRTTSAPAVFRQSKCEATTRKNKDGKTWSVWARYPVGPPKVRQDAGEARAASADKAQVAKAVATGTALKPPAPAPPRRSAPPANDMGMTKFLADRRARGAVDIPE